MGIMTFITKEQFVKREIDEWGFEYVEDLFASGYEPCIIDGRWCWANVSRSMVTPINGSNSLSRAMDTIGSNMGLVVKS